MAEFRTFISSMWNEEFDQKLAVEGTVKRAFEATERSFQQKTGRPYYASFESFKASRSMRRKRQKKTRTTSKDSAY